MGPSLVFFLASVGLTSVVARTLASAGGMAPPKLSDRATALSGVAMLTLAGFLGTKGGARLAIVRTSVTGAIVIFTALDYVLSIGLGFVRAVRQHYRTFGASLAPGGATLDAPRRKPSVVIVGGSFAGLRVQRELSDDGFDVTVVDLKEYFEYTPGVLRLYAQPERLTSLSAPLPRSRNQLVVGEATSVTPSALKVRLADAAEADGELELPYDYLLLAPGSSYPCAPIKPTAAERTLAARQASWDAAAAALRDAASALVVGGGLVGVELAAEIVEAHPTKRLTLLTSGDKLCATLPPRVGLAVRAWLEKRGVTIKFRARVASVDAAQHSVQLESGEALVAGVVYDCRGNGPPHSATLVGDGSALRAAADAKGRIAVDEHLRCCPAATAAHAKIFAAGDAMRLPGCNDLKVGHTAELNADVVAANIRRDAAATAAAATHDAYDTLLTPGEPALETYPHGAVGAAVAPRVFCVSLGEAYGVLSFNGIVLEGSLAAVVKALLEWTKVAACAERPIGTLFWKFGDAAANWISRNLVLPPDAPLPKVPATKATGDGEAEGAAPPMPRPLVLFDGVCLLCSTFIHFVLDHDKAEAFDFAALQSDYGKAALATHGMTSDLSTMVLIDEAGVHVRSTAALRVLTRCGWKYRLFATPLLWLLPRPLRDLGYKGVASVRYRLFGQDDGSSCRRMTKAVRKRFLDHQ